MNKYLFLFLSLSISFFFACKNNKKEKPSPKEKIEHNHNNKDTTSFKIDYTNPALVIFKKEQVLEFWENAQLSFRENLTIDPTLTIGVFNIIPTESGELSFQVSNDFYQSKFGKDIDVKKINITNTFFIQLPKDKLLLLKNNKQPPKQIFIFPNDARSTNQFDPCLACPHWMAEMYSSLLLHLKTFSTIK